MRRRPATTSPRERGFTLVELSVMILIVSLFAAMIVPGVVARTVAAKKRESYSAALRLFHSARESAIAGNVTYEITYDEAQAAFVSTRITPAQNNQPEERTDEGKSQLADGIRPGYFRLQSADSNPGDWKLDFYADGKSNGGGVEISEGNQTQSLSATADGMIKLQDGKLPDTSNETWSAGDYEHRQ